jgi:thiamine transporter 2/3
MASLCLTIVLVVALPNVPKHRVEEDTTGNDVQTSPLNAAEIETTETTKQVSVNQYIKQQWNAVVINFRSPLVLKWSLWWALASCGYYQVGNYVQNLWALNQEPDSPATIYNGVTETMNTLLGVLM